MSSDKTHIDEMLAELRQESEKLKLKLHLAKMEAGDEWKNLETKLARLESKAKELGGATAEASQDVVAAAKLLGGEIRDGFKKIARHL
jgi:SMC interacting uncharacterized protein involved in chromosome segregation